MRSGLFWQNDGNDGMEVSIGGSGCRATINSYQYGDAMAIARIAERAGQPDLAETWRAKAATLKQLVQEKLWDPEAQFFKVLPRGQTTLADVRELHGYTPWYFNLPDPDKSVAWKQLMDPEGFFAPFGPTTAEQRHPGFTVAYHGPRMPMERPELAAGHVGHADGPGQPPEQLFPGRGREGRLLEDVPVLPAQPPLPAAATGARAPSGRLTRSFDNTVARHTWWAEERLGGTEWVQYDFKTPVRAGGGRGLLVRRPVRHRPARRVAAPGQTGRRVAGGQGEGSLRHGHRPLQSRRVRARQRRRRSGWRPGRRRARAPASSSGECFQDGDERGRPRDALRLLQRHLRRPAERPQRWRLPAWSGSRPASPGSTRTSIRTRATGSPGRSCSSAARRPDERGKDYNHSTFCDLVITGVVGLRPRADDIARGQPAAAGGRLGLLLPRPGALPRPHDHDPLRQDRGALRQGQGARRCCRMAGRVAGSLALERVRRRLP